MKATEILVPVFGEVAKLGLVFDAASFFLSGFEFRLDGIGLGLGIGCANVFCVDLPERRMLLDLLVEQRLRDGGIVDFAVAVAPVADEIDDNIGAELVAIVHGHAGHANDGVDIFGVDVEDRDRLAARDARGEARRVLLGVARGESEKIVDDDVDGAADGVSRQVGIVHGLGEDALTGERCVSMNQEGNIFFGATFARAVLLGARAAHGDGIDGLEVAWVRNEVDVHLAAASSDIFAGRAHVIFHVARSKDAARIDIFKSREDFLGRTLGNVGNDVEAAAMAHPHDEFDCAFLRGAVQDFVDERNEGRLRLRGRSACCRDSVAAEPVQKHQHGSASRGFGAGLPARARFPCARTPSGVARARKDG